ncbi:hypothetical protein [Pseudomonas beijingensis]|jgi:hypothetical protein|uniref:Uncharacterized protein n=1 Tax=Pseudomonas beijingensis TaxID=2954101 RepID=A0ABY9F5L7_9PSED|nr:MULTISPECIES: hypothetical protein [unclassified Pseudomonas]WLG98814.1 hypothetical protein PSH92_15605 [Pseudomonas sp. FP2034]WLH43881.1 hypothetical protein PSH83_15945 [Pseudomonas sp. FP2262]WLI43942.1 hypothetical protein PSH84_20560 [Pseudomonas sp. FP830]
MRNSLEKIEKRKSAATCERKISHGVQPEGIDAIADSHMTKDGWWSEGANIGKFRISSKARIEWPMQMHVWRGDLSPLGCEAAPNPTPGVSDNLNGGASPQRG